MVEDVGFTTEGRLLMERLKKEKKAAGFYATTWRWLGPIFGFMAGGVWQIVLEIIKRKLKL